MEFTQQEMLQFLAHIKAGMVKEKESPLLLINHVLGYKNILLAFDKDNDLRLLECVKSLNQYHQDLLILAHEIDGTIAFIWSNDSFDSKYKTGNEIEICYNDVFDYWQINSYISLINKSEADFSNLNHPAINFLLNTEQLN